VSDKEKVTVDEAMDAQETGHGKVYEVDDRYLGVSRPKEQGMVIAFVILLVGGFAALWWNTRDSRAFSAAKETNTTVSYEAYLAAWPAGEFITPARKAIDDLAWDAHLAAGTFEAYLKEYPRGRHARSARYAIEDRTYREHKAAGQLGKYLEEFPTGRHAQRAKNELERIAREKFKACTDACWEKQDKENPDKESYTLCCEQECQGHMEGDACKAGPPPSPDGLVPGAPGAPGAPAPAPTGP